MAAWVGDGFCDDMTNSFQCNYDGGDCCGSNVDTGKFFEKQWFYRLDIQFFANFPDYFS